jgi:hypothetical protein
MTFLTSRKFAVMLTRPHKTLHSTIHIITFEVSFTMMFPFTIITWKCAFAPQHSYVSLIVWRMPYSPLNVNRRFGENIAFIFRVEESTYKQREQEASRAVWTKTEFLINTSLRTSDHTFCSSKYAVILRNVTFTLFFWYHALTCSLFHRNINRRNFHVCAL